MSHHSKSTLSINTEALNTGGLSAIDLSASHTPSDLYSAEYFDTLYNDNSDPWHYQTRWYEKRKRDMCLAVLPKAEYVNAIELGCGNGVFSEWLAHRCHALLSIDGHPQAVQLAKQRLVNYPHIKVISGIIPDMLSTLNSTTLCDDSLSNTLSSNAPLSNNLAENTSPFDLIVISEILYYLSPTDIDTVIAWIKQHIAIEGTLLCCHWRHAIDGFTMTGETVHERLQHAFNAGETLKLTHQSQIIDSDFLLDVWQNSTKTVAMQESLV